MKSEFSYKEKRIWPMRINKYMSDSGYCSRREADRLVQDGKVTVNNRIAVLGTKINERDEVKVYGNVISLDRERIVLAFNKPRGVECTTDRNNPDNIVDYVGYKKRIYPVGRLDKNSQGLILLTNDGTLVNYILKASNYHEKEYEVTVDKVIDSDFIKKMSSGVSILDTVTRPCKTTRISSHKFDIVLTQGLNRQIRRMCESLGYNVQKIKRVRIMSVKLDGIPAGSYRKLEDEEIDMLLLPCQKKLGEYSDE